MAFKIQTRFRSSLQHTRNQHRLALPVRSPETRTTSPFHFRGAFFQEIRLISFFLVSLSLLRRVEALLWLCKGVTGVVVDQQVVKLIITSSNQARVWWNWSRPVSFCSWLKASRYSIVFETARQVDGVISRYNPGTLTKPAGAMCCMWFCLLS